MKFKRAIVTGGSGFIGSHLVDKLLENDYEVFVIDNLRSGRISNIQHHNTNSKFIFEHTSILADNTKSIFKIFKPDVVFHLAAIPGVSYSVANPQESNEVNVSGTLNLLSLSHQFKVKKFIFSSSSSIYGGSEVLPTSETIVENPKSPYALQKKIGEDYCKLYSKTYDLDTVCLRYFNVFGPRQYGDSPYAAVIAAFADSNLRSERPHIHGNGEQFRDFCYVDNVVSANILAATHNGKLNGEVFNVGCGGKISVNQLSQLMQTLAPIYLEARAGDVKCSQADISKISKKLKYKTVMPFKEGLDATLKWYLENNKI